METNIYAISYKLRRELQHRIFVGVGLFFLFFVTVSLILNFIIFPVANKSESMSPDIPAVSYEFVSPLLKNPNRGDVVLLQNYSIPKSNVMSKALNTFALFVSFGKWQPFRSHEYGTSPVLRRVIGMPGDQIYINHYVVFIKPAGENLFHTEFEFPLGVESNSLRSKYNAKIIVPPTNWDSDFGSKSSLADLENPIVLGADEYFVLGDDRLSAADSRLWGPIKKKNIIGKSLFLYFPFNKFRFF